MPKLARPPKGRRKPPQDGKRYPLNMRTTAATRANLEKAAAASGRSLAQEIEHRLERSLEREASLAAHAEALLGGRRSASLFRALAHVAALDVGDERWLDDPELYLAARGRMTLILDEEKPKAPPSQRDVQASIDRARAMEVLLARDDLDAASRAAVQNVAAGLARFDKNLPAEIGPRSNSLASEGSKP